MQRLHQHDGAADGERQENPHRHHVSVKQRQDHGEGIFLDHCQYEAAALDVVQQVAVRKHRALRFARRAGRVNDDGQVGSLRSDLRFAICDLRFQPRNSSTRNILSDRPRRFEFCRVRAQFRIGDDDINSTVVQDINDLRRLQKIVDGHDDRARLQNAEDAREQTPGNFSATAPRGRPASRRTGFADARRPFAIAREVRRRKFRGRPKRWRFFARAFARNLRKRWRGSSGKN